jgi:uncharacterized membrane protein
MGAALAVTAALLFSTVPPGAATPTEQRRPEPKSYRIVEMAMISDGYAAYAYALNHRDETVGETYVLVDGVTRLRATKWDGTGRAVDLGVPPGTNDSIAYDINDRGVAVGIASPAFFDDFGSVALRWDPRNRRTVLLNPRGGSASRASAINNQGTVVGSSTIGETSRAVRWRGVTVHVLPLPRGYSQSYAGTINEAGTIIGVAAKPGEDLGSGRPVRWGPSRGVQVLSPLPGGTVSRAMAVNNAGFIVGTSDSAAHPGLSHAVRWDRSGKVKDLGVLPGGTYSEPIAINSAGTVIGIADSPETTNPQPIMWTAQGKLIRLRPLRPGAFGQPNAINDRGKIVGWSNLRDTDTFQGRPVVWTSTGRAVELPVPPASDEDDVSGVALAVNQRGTIMGRPLNGADTRIVLWKPRTLPCRTATCNR